MIYQPNIELWFKQTIFSARCSSTDNGRRDSHVTHSQSLFKPETNQNGGKSKLELFLIHTQHLLSFRTQTEYSGFSPTKMPSYAIVCIYRWESRDDIVNMLFLLLLPIKGVAPFYDVIQTFLLLLIFVRYVLDIFATESIENHIWWHLRFCVVYFISLI